MPVEYGETPYRSHFSPIKEVIRMRAKVSRESGVHVRLGRWEMEKLESLAERRGVSLAEMLRELLIRA
jgi:hypothetical protein